MRSCHNLSAGFDDTNLVSCAGLIPVMTLAERPGLHDLARAHVRVPGRGPVRSSASRWDQLPCPSRRGRGPRVHPVCL